AWRNLRPEIGQQDQDCSAAAFEQVLRLHASVIPKQEKEYPAVAQRLPRYRLEILSEALEERAFVEVSIEGIASTAKLAETDVACGNPLHHRPPRCEFVHQARDLGHWDLV